MGWVLVTNRRNEQDGECLQVLRVVRRDRPPVLVNTEVIGA